MIKPGFILIDKPLKLSSQRVDTILKKKYNLNKVGHLGTLDPLATGLLVVCIDDGTKYFKYFEDLPKKYILKIRFGATSPSLDKESELYNIIDTDLRGKESYLDSVLESFPKNYDQTPPLYSAIKVDGMPLYKYAIKNKDVEIKKRNVSIYSIKRTSDIEYINGSSYMYLELFVSKGFYVRSFAKELGDAINTPSMADEIRRVEIGPFNLDNSIEIDDEISNVINPLDYLDFPLIEINEKLYKLIQSGIQLDRSFTKVIQNHIILTYKNEKIAIYKFDGEVNRYRLDILIKNENIIR